MRETKFYNSAATSISSGTASTYKDIVSVTGAGIVDHVWVVATATASNIDNYRLVIDGNNYDFDFSIFGLDEINTRVEYGNTVFITNKKILFNSSLAIQGLVNTVGSASFKYSVMTHELT